MTELKIIYNAIYFYRRPSSSQDENLPSEITEAEYAKDCNNRYKKCPQSPLALIRYHDLNDNS